MGNGEYYESRINEIKAICDDETKMPNVIPLETYLQEADNLYEWCQYDKEEFLKINFDWKIVEDIPVRAGALREAMARWSIQRATKGETVNLWKQKSKQLLTLRNMLLHNFHFAYQANADIKGCISKIARSNSHAALIQDLNDLAKLGKDNPAELEVVNFDMSLLDTAVNLTKEFAETYAASTIEEKSNEAKIIRDKAYTYLKQAVDKVYICGNFLFWQNKARKIGYTSAYLREVRIKQSRKKQDANNTNMTHTKKQKNQATTNNSTNSEPIISNR